MASLKGDNFYRAVRDVSARLGCRGEDLIAVMFLESGLKPAAVNPASSATGLIQFMPSLLQRWGISREDVAKMSDVDQMSLVEKYLGHALFSGKLGTLTDLYLSVFWPAGVGKPADYTIASKGDPVYRDNAGLDANGDGKITNSDISAKMKSVEGREEVKRFVEEFRLVCLIDSLPKDDAAERIARLNEHFVDSGPGPRLRALAARVESRPDAEMYRATNCATYTRWIWAAAGCTHAYCHMPDEQLRSLRPAGPVDWLRYIAAEHKAMIPYDGDPTKLNRGDGLRYQEIGNDDHIECSVLSKPDAKGIASHAGGGRGGNKITQGVSDIRSSFAFGRARRIREVFLPFPLLGLVKPIEPPKNLADLAKIVTDTNIPVAVRDQILKNFEASQKAPEPPPVFPAEEEPTLPSVRDPKPEVKPLPAEAKVRDVEFGALAVAVVSAVAAIVAYAFGACN